MSSNTKNDHTLQWFRTPQKLTGLPSSRTANLLQEIQTQVRNAKNAEKIAKVHFMKKDWTQCRDYYKEALSYLNFCKNASLVEGISQQDLNKYKQLQMQYYNKIAYCELQNRNYQPCIEFATKSLEINPRNDLSLFYRAKAFRMLSKLELARKDIQKAIEIKNSDKYLMEKNMIERVAQGESPEELEKLSTFGMGRYATPNTHVTVESPTTEDEQIQRAIEESLKTAHQAKLDEREKNEKLRKEKLIEFYKKQFEENERTDDLFSDEKEEEDDVTD